MANRKISALTQLTTSSIASGDKVPIVDASDTTDDPSTGTTKYFDGNDLFFKSVGGTVTANTNLSGTVTLSGSVSVTAPSNFTGTATISSLINPATKPTSSSNGSINYNAPTTTSPLIDCISGTTSGLLLRATDVLTNNTNKQGRFVTRHYDNSEEDVLFFYTNNTTGSNIINYGGNSSLFNSITQHSFFVGTANTHLTGTEAFRVTNGSVVAFKPFTAGSALDVTGTAQMDGIRLDQAPTSGAVTTTHYFTINLNGTTYRVPCGTA